MARAAGFLPASCSATSAASAIRPTAPGSSARRMRTPGWKSGSRLTAGCASIRPPSPNPSAPSGAWGSAARTRGVAASLAPRMALGLAPACPARSLGIRLERVGGGVRCRAPASPVAQSGLEAGPAPSAGRSPPREWRSRSQPISRLVAATATDIARPPGAAVAPLLSPDGAPQPGARPGRGTARLRQAADAALSPERAEKSRPCFAPISKRATAAVWQRRKPPRRCGAPYANCAAACVRKKAP